MPSGFTDPLGTIRIIRSKPPVRRIKIRMEGRPQDKWMDFARHWWIHNRGPVPQGKRVGHLDGDTLNDDPSNLALLDPGDVVFLWHDRDPVGSAQNFEKMRRATAERNRMRSVIHRAGNWLPTRWYPVDPVRQLIINRPHRQQWQCFADCGVDVVGPARHNALSTALGWPGHPEATACMLTALAAGDLLSGTTLRSRAREIRTTYGSHLGQMSRHHMYTLLGNIPQGWIKRLKSPGRRPLYALSDVAFSSRGPVCPWIPMRGREFGWPPYHHFAREPDFPVLPLHSAA